MQASTFTSILNSLWEIMVRILKTNPTFPTGCTFEDSRGSSTRLRYVTLYAVNINHTEVFKALGRFC